MSKLMVQEGNLELATISERMESTEIYINQDYQRDFVYDNARQSRLIESFLLGIPVPEIFLCECKSGKDEVIDGQQRVTSIHRYLTNKFTLSGLTTLTDLNGKRFGELPTEIQRILRKRTLNFIRIPMTNEKLKFEIFARLNQGSTALSHQEIRNCIYHGSCNDMLVRLAKDPLAAKLFRDKNLRFCYQERILNFFAMQDFKNLPFSARTPIMNQFMIQHQNMDDVEIASMEKKFRDTMQVCDALFDDEAFYLPDMPKKAPFNRAIFESIAIGLSQFPKEKVLAQKDAVRAAVMDLKTNNPEYQESVIAKKSSKGHICARITFITETVQKVLDEAKTSAA